MKAHSPYPPESNHTMSHRRPKTNAPDPDERGVSGTKTSPSTGTTQLPGKTLYEIAAARQAQLRSRGEVWPGAAEPQNVKIVTVKPGGKVEEGDAEPVSPLLDTLFLAASLSALHFTLEVLTVHQYAQELRFPPIFAHTSFVAFPTLLLAVHFAHGHLPPLSRMTPSDRLRQRARAARQMLFLIAANVAGCYLIRLTNDRGYYAVMKKAPSIGTIWVWCVLELGLAGALAGVAGPGLYAWYYGYGIF